MTDEELLQKVKVGLGITGTYQDEALKIYIEDVKGFLVEAGVQSEIVNSSDSVGVIVRGVSDLWNYGMGTAEFSQYFMQRAAQLSYKKADLE
ncbi:MAG: phage gp6-like head-tail connector protein [Ruminococcus sp.]|nr:phage gp6-like head-tail connector protein [Ruminococcus sp.]